ncbi:unannotated protein [freshwater metagenome]|uniref:Unannotated protein n=1 Tax=freshwater metagenome TaxID=449393 RepID=A0A6J7GKK1_9ZZZZ
MAAAATISGGSEVAGSSTPHPSVPGIDVAKALSNWAGVLAGATELRAAATTASCAATPMTAAKRDIRSGLRDRRRPTSMSRSIKRVGVASDTLVYPSAPLAGGRVASSSRSCRNAGASASGFGVTLGVATAAGR